MIDQRKKFGSRGENLAAAFLQGKGFRLIGQNWRCALGEIDLIMERDGDVRFVEVNTRQTTTYGYPEQAITPTKLKHLARAIELWLRQSKMRPKRYQADAVAIQFSPQKEPEIRWIEGIF